MIFFNIIHMLHYLVPLVSISETSVINLDELLCYDNSSCTCRMVSLCSEMDVIIPFNEFNMLIIVLRLCEGYARKGFCEWHNSLWWYVQEIRKPVIPVGVYSYLRWNNRSEVSHRTQTNKPIKLATMSLYRADPTLIWKRLCQFDRSAQYILIKLRTRIIWKCNILT